jgi:hypothetical protein
MVMMEGRPPHGMSDLWKAELASSRPCRLQQLASSCSCRRRSQAIPACTSGLLRETWPWPPRWPSQCACACNHCVFSAPPRGISPRIEAQGTRHPRCSTRPGS